MFTKSEIENRIVIVGGNVPPTPGDFFRCSNIQIGNSIAGEWMLTKVGAIVPLDEISLVSSDEEYGQVIDRAVKEEQERKERDQARIKEVVASVEDLEEQMNGKIVIYARGLQPEDRGLQERRRPACKGATRRHRHQGISSNNAGQRIRPQHPV